MKIMSLTKMIVITKTLQEVHANLWGQYKPDSILDKNHIALLLDKFTCKS